MIIGLSGYAQTGKDTVAEHIVKSYGYKRVAFADPIRQALYKLDPKIRIDEMTGASLANAVDHMGWEEVKKLSSDARELLQRFGTEVGREMFGQDFWVDQAFRGVSKFNKIVFADVRFPNEFRAIKSREGIILRIVKPGTAAVNYHVSETALDNHSFDATIVNDGSKEDLYKKIDDVIRKYA